MIIDTTCPHCQGAMRVKSIATEPGDILAILETAVHARAPPTFSSTPPQFELDFAAAA